MCLEVEETGWQKIRISRNNLKTFSCFHVWLIHCLSLISFLFASHSSSPVIPSCLPVCPVFFFPSSCPNRSFLSVSLRRRFPRRRPRRPILDPGPELANPLSERREDGALLQEGLRRRPPPWHRRRWRRDCFLFTRVERSVHATLGCFSQQIHFVQ